MTKSREENLLKPIFKVQNNYIYFGKYSSWLFKKTVILANLGSSFNGPLGFSSSSSDSEPSSSATAIGTPFSGWSTGWEAAS